MQLKQTQELADALDELGTNGLAGIPAIVAKQGLGTFVIKDMVYDYAMWINPRFKVLVIRTFDAVVTQATKIAEALTWEQQRQAGKEFRAGFTSTLKEHGVAGFGFAQCTNSIYRPLFGDTASKLKQQRGLAKQASLRDAMSGEELIASAFAEIVASQRLDANADQGNSPCYRTCKASGKAVGSLLIKKLK